MEDASPSDYCLENVGASTSHSPVGIRGLLLTIYACRMPDILFVLN
jgi:hypothetical protein